eukprot:6172710-Pleurochrysis_carterae.AAC.4
MVKDKLPKVSAASLVVTWTPAESNTAEGPDLADHNQLTDTDEQRELLANATAKKGDKAWKQRKVFSDITLKTMLAFPAAQRARWRAMAAFYEDYVFRDQVLPLPLTLKAPSATAQTTCSWIMQHGSPFSWAAAWEKLSWRYPRPHGPAADSRPKPGAQHQQVTAAADAAAASRAARVRDGSALINGVTGINAARATRRRAMTLRVSILKGIDVTGLCTIICISSEVARLRRSRRLMAAASQTATDAVTAEAAA